MFLPVTGFFWGGCVERSVAVVIWYSENYRVFKYINKLPLPLLYRSIDDPAPLPRCPPEMPDQQIGEILFRE
jgi:hypothetical protein